MKYITKLGGLTNPPFTSYYKDKIEKLYADGTGRNAMDGTFSGVLIGHFINIEAKLPPGIDDTTMSSVLNELKKEEIEVTYFDSSRGTMRTSILRPNCDGVEKDLKGINKEVSFTLVAQRRD